MRISKVPVGSEVLIRGLVVRQAIARDRQALVKVPGIGGSGCWSIVGTADCKIVGQISVPILVDIAPGLPFDLPGQQALVLETTLDGT